MQIAKKSVNFKKGNDLKLRRSCIKVMKYYKGFSFNIEAVAKVLSDIAESSKRIGRCSVSYEDLSKALTVIARVNNLDEYARSLDGILLDDVKIPECLKAFVSPSKISFVVGDRYPNLKMRDVNDREFKWSIRDLFEINNHISSTFKTESKMVAITELRQQSDLNSVKYAVNLGDGEYFTHVDDAYNFIPVVVSDAVGVLIGNHVANESADYVIERYLSNFSFC